MLGLPCYALICKLIPKEALGSFVASRLCAVGKQPTDLEAEEVRFIRILQVVEVFIMLVHIQWRYLLC